MEPGKSIASMLECELDVYVQHYILAMGKSLRNKEICRVRQIKTLNLVMQIQYDQEGVTAATYR
jgi:hypothetical protein